MSGPGSSSMEFSTSRLPIVFTHRDIEDILATGSSHGEAKVHHLWAYWFVRYGRDDDAFVREHLAMCDAKAQAEVLRHLRHYEIGLREPIVFATETGCPDYPVTDSVPLSPSEGQVLVDPDALVIPEDTISVLIDYPLENSTKVVLRCQGGFTRQDLVQRLQSAYTTIYEEEARTSTIVPESMRSANERWLAEHPEATPEERRQHSSKLLNRVATDGTFGIYGHDQGDLVLVEMRFKNGDYTLLVDS